MLDDLLNIDNSCFEGNGSSNLSTCAESLVLQIFSGLVILKDE